MQEKKRLLFSTTDPLLRIGMPTPHTRTVSQTQHDTAHNTHCPYGSSRSPGSIIRRPRVCMQPTVPVTLIARSSNIHDIPSNQGHLRSIIWVDTSYCGTRALMFEVVCIRKANKRNCITARHGLTTIWSTHARTGYAYDVIIYVHKLVKYVLHM